MTTRIEEEKPLYLGHRARLRERFMVDEGASMPDYELLELLLTMAIPRRDVKPIAKKLLLKLKNIRTVLHTPAHKLLDICKLPPNAIVLFRLFNTCALRSAYCDLTVSEEPVITTWESLEEMCWNLLAFKEVEEFWVFFLDSTYHYKGKRQLSCGTIDRAIVHPREIMRAAIEFESSKIVLAHNHPSGDYKPSKFDIAMTRSLEELGETMDFEVYDHLIAAKDGIFSFRNNGLIKKKKPKSEDATGMFDKSEDEDEDEDKKSRSRK